MAARDDFRWPHCHDPFAPQHTLPQDEPWTASVFRTADKARVALAGSVEGTVDDVVDRVVMTFLTGTELGMTIGGEAFD